MEAIRQIAAYASLISSLAPAKARVEARPEPVYTVSLILLAAATPTARISVGRRVG